MTDELPEQAKPGEGGPPPEIEGSLSGRGKLSAQNRAAVNSAVGRQQPDDRAVHCAGCGERLDEPVGLPLEQRQPCQNCGETARQVRITLTATVSAASGEAAGDVIVHPPAAVATATALPGRVVISSSDFVRTLTWSQTEGGMWLAFVHKPNGEIAGVAVQEDSQDVLLILEQDLRPPEKGQSID